VRAARLRPRSRAALTEPDTALRVFGKPEVRGHRRVAVALARADGIEAARAKARRVAGAITVTLDEASA
jgi:phosphoribosylglycinamide formyltransferase 2